MVEDSRQARQGMFYRVAGMVVLGVLALVALVIAVRMLRRRAEPAAPEPLPTQPQEPRTPQEPAIIAGTGEDDIACVPPPPPEISPMAGVKGLNSDELWMFLQQETYRQRGEGFRSDWAFHLYATLNDLGAPLGHSARNNELVAMNGRSYGFQAFARDTLFNEIPHWSDVQRLSSRINGQIPGSGLYAALLAASFRSSGGTLRPTQAFAQFVVRERLGPALSEGFTITVESQRYDMQLFALDTLYSPVGRSSEVGRLSTAPAGALREQLWHETYRVIGATYDPASSFHQFGVAAGLGTPLTGVYRAERADQVYDLQIFALDAVYASPGGEPDRHASLPRPEAFTKSPGSGASGPDDPAQKRDLIFSVLPLAGQPRIAQFYGYTRYAAGAGRGYYGATQGRHSGIDFAVPVGTPLLALDFGLVVWSGANVERVSFGAGPRSIIVRYGNVYALYGHVSSEAVSKGQLVSPGQVLGRSGFPSSPHLHFELRPVPERMRAVSDATQNPVNPGYAVNPLDYFSTDLRGYFDQQLSQLGGARHFCRGTLIDQERISFGAPVDTRPCA